MQLTILGSGTGIATKNRNAPGYLINVGNKLILLDAGEGTKRQIIKAGFDLFSLTHIFITHTHVDHVAEIPAIVWPFHFTRVKSVLNFFGPPRFKKFFGTAFKAFIPNINQRKKLKIKIRELKNNKIKLDDITIETRLMTEKMGSTFCEQEIGYSITSKNKSVVFCGDNTEESLPDIMCLAKNCDLLILDCGQIKPGNGHLTPTLAGQIAQAAQVKKLLLTHFYPEMEKIDIKKIVKKYYSGPIILAKYLMKIKI